MRICAGLALAVVICAAGCARLPGPESPHGAVAALPVDQSEARDMISAYRRGHRLAEVTLDPALQIIAQHQAVAMAQADQLSHSVAGPLPSRLASEGLERRAMVENVSAGYGTLAGALAGWRRSPAHDANLLFGPVHQMGIAAAVAPGTRFKTFWALVMTD